MKLVAHCIQDILAENLPKTAYYQLLQQFLAHPPEVEPVSLSLQTLPLLVCEAGGGEVQRAVPLAAAWQILYRAVKLFDDIEDGEPYNRPAEAINLGMGLLFVAQAALDLCQTRHTDLGVTALRQTFNRAILRACAGQHDDLTAGRVYPGQTDPETWLEIAGAKSGELFAWAVWAGAAGVDEARLACYRQYGYHLGILLQVADDFNDIWQSEAPRDLLTGSLNLAVCYALAVVETQEREKLNRYLRQAAQGDRQVAAQLRQRLTALGAQAYLLVVGRTQRQQAIAALAGATGDVPAHHPLIALLDQVLPAAGDSC